MANTWHDGDDDDNMATKSSQNYKQLFPVMIQFGHVNKVLSEMGLRSFVM
jgi:hypothetical protein